MKSQWIRRLIGGVLAMSMILSSCASGPQKNGTALPAVSLTDEEVVTMGKAADYLSFVAARYNKTVPSREELLSNAQGLEEKDPVSRIHALVMVSKAFGILPEPVGNDERTAPKDVDLSQIPDWAKASLEQLNKAGVLAETDLQKKEPSSENGGASEGEMVVGYVRQSDPITAETSESEESGQSDGAKETSSSAQENSIITGKELKTIVRRIYALYGSELKDDFYAAVNKHDLETKEIPAGETDAGGTYDQRILVQNQVNTIIREIVEGSGYAPNSMEQKIKTYFESAVDFQTRNALGAEPLRPYLDAIDRATNLQELTEAQIFALENLGTGGLLTIFYATDPRDNQRLAPTLFPPVDPMAPGGDVSLLVLAGEDQEKAEANYKVYQELLQGLNDYMPSLEEYGDPANIKFITVKELKELLPGMDVEAVIRARGDDVPEEIAVSSLSLFEGFGKLMQDPKYLDGIKTALKLELITEFYNSLSEEFLNAFAEDPEQKNQNYEEIAYAMVTEYLSGYIDQLYIERYFSPEAKLAVEDMVKHFIQVYKERIQKLDWLGEETKQEAIQKLDTMKFYIGYTEQNTSFIDQLEITDNLFENQAAIIKMRNQQNREDAAAQNRGETQGSMNFPVATVNAFYNQFKNAMYFPAGILQAPSFDINASFEENLGGIGVTIAHEISHAFDNKGAMYDAYGLPKDWWTPEDYAAFQKLCDKCAAFYDGWETAAGIPIDGNLTLGENIADIGGMACALEVLGQKENPDYDAFFRAYAKGWLKCTTRSRAEDMASFDEHSPSNLRVNRVLVNFQEFYDTYDIQPGDGMYVAPSDRIKIW